VSLKEQFTANFLSLKIKAVAIDMKRHSYPTRDVLENNL